MNNIHIRPFNDTNKKKEVCCIRFVCVRNREARPKILDLCALEYIALNEILLTVIMTVPIVPILDMLIWHFYCLFEAIPFLKQH